MQTMKPKGQRFDNTICPGVQATHVALTSHASQTLESRHEASTLRSSLRLRP